MLCPSTDDFMGFLTKTFYREMMINKICFLKGPITFLVMVFGNVCCVSR